MQKVKLVWVYSGPDAESLAKTKLLELDQIGEYHNLDFYSGTEYVSHISWLAYMIVSEGDRVNYMLGSNPDQLEEIDL